MNNICRICGARLDAGERCDCSSSPDNERRETQNKKTFVEKDNYVVIRRDAGGRFYACRK